MRFFMLPLFMLVLVGCVPASVTPVPNTVDLVLSTSEDTGLHTLTLTAPEGLGVDVQLIADELIIIEQGDFDCVPDLEDKTVQDCYIEASAFKMVLQVSGRNLSALAVYQCGLITCTKPARIESP